MNGKIKIFSRAILLGRYMKMIPVLMLTVILTLIFNNLFFIGEPILLFSGVEKFFSSLTIPFMKPFFIFFFAVATQVMSFLALSPFRFGRNIWFFENAKKNNIKIRKIFLFYRPKLSSRCIGLYFRTGLLKLAATVLFLVPAITLGVYAFVELGKGIEIKLFVFLCIFVAVLTLCGLFFAFVFSQRYFLAEYLYFENSGDGIKESIKSSAKIMDNECFKTAFFKMSFIPWFILCVFILPAVYVYPYYKTAVSFKAVTMLSNVKNNG